MPIRQSKEKEALGGGKVLRRRSWPFIFWVGIVFMWLIYSLTLLTALVNGDRREPFLLAAITLAITSLFHRIGTCKIVLRESSLQVDNFFLRSLVTYRSISRVDGSSSGGLNIRTRDGSGVSSFAFGGSLLDGFFKTSERAAEEISSRLNSKGSAARPMESERIIRRIRPCWFADGSLAVAAIFMLVGLAQ
ncbi:hypothetical protein ABTX35_09050 [Streptomyces sp. NPDC096080]|uniref:hypothetical protein n=1 Tax=Streptomyces sp. NPDC096080 TaxID=3156693 RepID=UPI003328E220